MSITYKPKTRKRLKTHGFLIRMRKHSGKKVLKERRRKKRQRINVA